ncbi:MAG: hypothetical protein WD492_11145 [Alkalispirochaeta sp.]
MSLHLKPQDVVVLLKLVGIGDRRWTYSGLARELGMSASEVHGAIDRAQTARLYADVLRTVMHPNLLEFLVHGVRYAFPVQLGPPVWGMPTAHAALPLNRVIVADEPLPPVWEAADGTTQGISVTPLYRSVIGRSCLFRWRCCTSPGDRPVEYRASHNRRRGRLKVRTCRHRFDKEPPMPIT